MYVNEYFVAFSLNNCRYYAPSDIPNLHKTMEPKNTLSVFGINCRGLTNSLDNLKFIMNEMNTPNTKLDIIGVTETFNVIENINYNLKGYHTPEFNVRPEGDDGRGGVCGFVY